MLEETETSHTTSDDSDTHNESHSLYSFKLIHFQEIKCCTGEARPEPRFGHRIVQYKGSIYSFGGYKEPWELNLTTGRWTKCEMKGDIPELLLIGHTAVCHPLDPGVMLMYGGIRGDGVSSTTSNTVVSCHLKTKQFKKLVTQVGEGQPMALIGQAVVTDNKGLLYTVGGYSESTATMDVNVLDLRSSPPVWSSLYKLSGVRDEPAPRWGHELCLWEGKLVVLGGLILFSPSSVEADRFEDLPTFDIEEKRWFYTRTKADQHATMDNSDDGYPKKRGFHRTVQIGKHVWVFGGKDRHNVFGDAWQLDLSTMQWTKLKMELPFPVYFHAMTVSDEGQMVMFGGMDEQRMVTDRVITAWLTVPSLRSMAWDAVCHYQPSILTMPLTTLLQEGVPKDCVEMLGSDATSQSVQG